MAFLVIIVVGPVLGALCAIALRYTRPWQLMLGAMVGEALAVVPARLWSHHAAAQAMRGMHDGRDHLVMVRATGLGWRHYLIVIAVSAAYAVLVGGLVALVRRTVVAAR